ncbi:MAG: LPXTG cell wall anchor domain-containing protein [Herbiconiux sp.]|nr:LPXTG cell wall anchor domain-containing protein [Herbiconiux sp.]
MPLYAPSRLRAARASILAAVACAALAAVLLVNPTTASATEVPPSPSAEAAEGAEAAEPGLGDVGSGLLLEAKSDPAGTSKFGPVTFSTGTTAGTFRITNPNGSCLNPPAKDGISPFVYDEVCLSKGNHYQDWALVPASQNPSSAAGSDPEGHWFYLLAPAQSYGPQLVLDSCLTRGNLPPFPAIVLTVEPCSAGDTHQLFRISNDAPNPQGIAIEWQNALRLAVVHATSVCDSWSADCQVSPRTGTYAGQWFRSDDPNISSLGTLSKVAKGCGTPTSGTAKIQNTADLALTKSITTEQSLTNTLSVANTVAVTVEAEVSGGVKDVWSAKLGASFSYENQTVKTNSSTQSVSDTISQSVLPGRWLMGTWTQQTYTLDGTWKLGLTTPATTEGGLSWTIPAVSSHPVSVNGNPFATYSAVSSRDEKDCNAGAASTIGTLADQQPTPVLAANLCGTHVSSGQVAHIDSVVTACPGTWNIPVGRGTSEPTYAYQWYLKTGGQGAFTPIQGATSPRFRVTAATLGSTRLFLGVSVQEIGPAERLESTEVFSAVTVTLPAAHSVGAEPTDDPTATPSPATPGGSGSEPAGAAGRGTLAATGAADPSGVAWIAVALLLAGATVVVIRRRRRA